MEKPSQGNIIEERLDNGDILRTRYIEIGNETLKIRTIFTTRRFRIGDTPAIIQQNKDFDGVEIETFYEISGPISIILLISFLLQKIIRLNALRMTNYFIALLEGGSRYELDYKWFDLDTESESYQSNRSSIVREYIDFLNKDKFPRKVYLVTSTGLDPVTTMTLECNSEVCTLTLEPMDEPEYSAPCIPFHIASFLVEMGIRISSAPLTPKQINSIFGERSLTRDLIDPEGRVFDGIALANGKKFTILRSRQTQREN